MMEQPLWVSAVQQGRIEWSAHALRKMLGREISRDAVKHIIISGEAMESYPSDTPFPSVLLFGTWHNQPLHVVMAYDESSRKVLLLLHIGRTMNILNPILKPGEYHNVRL